MGCSAMSTLFFNQFDSQIRFFLRNLKYRITNKKSEGEELAKILSTY